MIEITLYEPYVHVHHIIKKAMLLIKLLMQAQCKCILLPYLLTYLVLYTVSMPSYTDHVSVRLLSHQAAERHDWCDAGEEQENGRRQTLWMKSVFYIGAVFAVTLSDVVDQTAAESVDRSLSWNNEL